MKETLTNSFEEILFNSSLVHSFRVLGLISELVTSRRFGEGTPWYLISTQMVHSQWLDVLKHQCHTRIRFYVVVLGDWGGSIGVLF